MDSFFEFDWEFCKNGGTFSELFVVPVSQEITKEKSGKIRSKTQGKILRTKKETRGTLVLQLF